MIGYYLELALQNLKRSPWLTALIVATVAIGIGSSMTVYTVLYTMTTDPIPQKSARLFVPELELLAPGSPVPMEARANLFSWPDAMRITRTGPAFRRAAMYPLAVTVTTGNPDVAPLIINGHATQADFFPMFDVPFRQGGPWARTEDEAAALVVVLTAELAARLFPEGNAVDQTLQLEGRSFRVIGVLDEWQPVPRFYDALYGVAAPSQLFMPLDTAVALSRTTPQAPLATRGVFNTMGGIPAPGSGYLGFLACLGCQWLQLWVELRSPEEVQRYRDFLVNDAKAQQASGRFGFTPRTGLRSLRTWLLDNRLVPDVVRIASLVAFGFLLVCLINAVALMLARFSRRGADLAVRRALGAPRSSLFAQCLVETAVIGVLGGAAGLLLTWLGVQLERSQLPPGLAQAARINGALILMTLGLALVATIAAGVYPAWRASRTFNAAQLKS
jgi:putative ABC transport system permease protein